MANVSVVGPADESSYLKYNGRKLPWGFLPVYHPLQTPVIGG